MVKESEGKVERGNNLDLVSTSKTTFEEEFRKLASSDNGALTQWEQNWINFTIEGWKMIRGQPEVQRRRVKEEKIKSTEFSLKLRVQREKELSHLCIDE